jgi:hypothetical protein
MRVFGTVNEGGYTFGIPTAFKLDSLYNTQKHLAPLVKRRKPYIVKLSKRFLRAPSGTRTRDQRIKSPRSSAKKAYGIRVFCERVGRRYPFGYSRTLQSGEPVVLPEHRCFCFPGMTWA